MGPARSRKDLIGFGFAVGESYELAKDFMAQHDATKLHEFFVEKGFTEISKDACKGILEERKRLEKLREKERKRRKSMTPSDLFCPEDLKY
jgi:hypothetical protein